MTALKICSVCDTEKPLDEFGTYVSRGCEYYRKQCKECRNTKERDNRSDYTRELERQQYKRKVEADPEGTSEYYRNWHLKRKYGITHDEYLEMLEEQNGCCKICSLPATEERHGVLRVDHDHETGQVRALLCHHCNVLLGHSKEDIEILEKAIDYLKEFK